MTWAFAPASSDEGASGGSFRPLRRRRLHKHAPLADLGSGSTASRSFSSAWAPQDALRFVHVAERTARGRRARTCRACSRARAIRRAFHQPLRRGVRGAHSRRRAQHHARGSDAHDALVREHACAMESETGEHPTEFELMTAVALEHFSLGRVRHRRARGGAWRQARFDERHRAS